MSVHYKVYFMFKEKLSDKDEKGGETNVTCDLPITSAQGYYDVSRQIGKANNYESVRILFTIPPAENMEEIIAEAQREKGDPKVIEGEVIE